MDFETWKNMILDIATQISDRDYQKRSWFGQGVYISSPDELYAGLFDDAIIEDFLTTHSKDLTNEQRDSGRNLVHKMNQYAEVTPEHLDPANVIDDPRWEDIRRSALAFVSALKTQGTHRT